MSTAPGYEDDRIAEGGKGRRPGYALTPDSGAPGDTVDIGDDNSSRHPVASITIQEIWMSGPYLLEPIPTWLDPG